MSKMDSNEFRVMLNILDNTKMKVRYVTDKYGTITIHASEIGYVCYSSRYGFSIIKECHQPVQDNYNEALEASKNKYGELEYCKGYSTDFGVENINCRDDLLHFILDLPQDVIIQKMVINNPGNNDESISIEIGNIKK